MKKWIICTTILILCTTMCLAQTGRTHTLMRGETLESVAKKYDISVEELKKANPGAEKVHYVGMSLIIPSISDSNIQIINDSSAKEKLKDNPVKEKVNDIPVHKTNLGHETGKKFEYDVFAGLSLNGVTGDGVKKASFSLGFHAGLTGRYYVWEGLFAEASLAFATKGYKVNNSSSSGSIWDDYGPNYDSEIKDKLTTYNIEIPINIGYKISFPNDFSLKIKTGPYLTYAIAGKEKQSGYTTYYTDIHSSEKEYIDKSTSIGDIKGYKSFGVGIGVSLGIEYHNITLMGTYQHGLTKLIEKSSIYEQNILVTLGYCF